MCLQKIIHKLFLEHPESVGESYLQHGYVACSYGSTLVCYGIAEFIHAVIPSIDIFHMFETTSEECLEKIVASLNARTKQREKPE